MNNQNGSILTATLLFVLVFSMSGLAMLYRATVQSEATQRAVNSLKDFWIADAIVEINRRELVNGNDAGAALTLDGTEYNKENDNIELVDDPDCVSCFNRWRVRSKVLVNAGEGESQSNPITRGIEAVVAAYDISRPITTRGTINGSCTGASIVPPERCASHANFKFQTVFNGTSFDDFRALAITNGTYFDLSSSGDPFDVKDVTVLNMQGGSFSTVTFDTDDPAVYEDNVLLIVDTREYTGGIMPTLDIDGSNDFRGIIWTIGEMNINSVPYIRGAVFIDGDPSGDTPLPGTTHIVFNPQYVDDTVDGFGGTNPSRRKLIAWKEVSP